MSEFTPKSERLCRLIAAAPEMYELLRVWVKVQAQPTLHEAQEAARKLLTRIDGEEVNHEEPEV